MIIHELRDLLAKTIQTKEDYLTEWRNADMINTNDKIHRATMVGYLEANVHELKMILADIDLAVVDTNTLLTALKARQESTRRDKENINNLQDISNLEVTEQEEEEFQSLSSRYK